MRNSTQDIELFLPSQTYATFFFLSRDEPTVFQLLVYDRVEVSRSPAFEGATRVLATFSEV